MRGACSRCNLQHKATLGEPLAVPSLIHPTYQLLKLVPCTDPELPSGGGSEICLQSEILILNMLANLITKWQQKCAVRLNTKLWHNNWKPLCDLVSQVTNAMVPGRSYASKNIHMRWGRFKEGHGVSVHVYCRFHPLQEVEVQE